MTITVEIGHWAAKHAKTGVFTLDVPDGSTVENVISKLNLPPGETGLCAVANKHVARGHVLRERDYVKFYPCIVGG